MLVHLALCIGVGACIGAVTGYFGKCSSGRCPLTANPYRGALFGAVLGGIFAVMSDGFRKGENREHSVEDARLTNQTEISAASTSTHPGALVHVNNAEEFRRYVLKASVPCVADFYSDRCGPCQMLSPTMEKLAVKYAGRTAVCKVNLDSVPELADLYKITAIPAVLFFYDGNEAHRLIGLRHQADYENVLETMLKE